MDFLFWLAATAAAVFVAFEALWWLGLLDDPPCNCEACIRARSHA